MATDTDRSYKAPGGWEWPDDLPEPAPPTQQKSETRSETRWWSKAPKPKETPQASSQKETPKAGSQKEGSKTKRQRHWKPRMCRICLDTVLPTFHPPSEHLPGMFQGGPSVTYDSDGGRLIRPCKCKGSSRYVHENCLQEWRHADPSYGRRNFWQCPTCGFQYRLERINWGLWISSTVTQITLTLAIFFSAVFLLGFVADPIINLYLDPFGTVSHIPSTSHDLFEDYAAPTADEEESSWAFHFAKGLASLGLLGFVKVFFAAPWHWFNLRNIMGGGGRTGSTGRDRLNNLSWVVVLVGVVTILYTVWKAVRAWSRRVLEKASERVVDVQGDDDDDDDGDSE